TEALATELRLKHGFNEARIVNVKKTEVPLQFPISALANRASANESDLITWLQLKLYKNQFRRALENCLLDDKSNRKLASTYMISGYKPLALPIVLVENKNNDRRILKITKKDKAKVLSEHYCNIPLADPNQFEIKKYKRCSRNTSKMIEKFDEGACISQFDWNKILGTLPRSYIKDRKRILDLDEKRISKKIKSELSTNSLNENLC
ncbi:26910_t:CDS:2, partial [Gigaspora margarita]